MRRKQRGVHPVAGHVADRHAEGVLRALAVVEKVEVVPADLIAAERPAGHIQPFDAGGLPGEQASLHLGRQGQRPFLQAEVGQEEHVAGDAAAVVPQPVAVDEHRYLPAVLRGHGAFELGEVAGEEVLAVEHQELAVILVGEAQGRAAEDRVAVPADHAAEGRVDIGHHELAVHEEEALVGRLDDAPVLFLGFAALRLGFEPLELGRGAGRENLEDGPRAGVLRHGAGVQDRQIADDPAAAVQQRRPQIAGGVDGAEVGVGGVEADHVVGVVDDVGALDDGFAGGAGDVDQEIAGQRAVGPVGQSAQLAAVGEIFRDPGAVGVEDLRQARHQGVEEAPAGGRGRALQDGAQRRVLVRDPRCNRVGGWHSSVIPWIEPAVGRHGRSILVGGV
jgi:hypothetical protein